MKIKSSPPLTVHFVWHPSDNYKVKPILKFIEDKFARDPDKPFSRGLNIPLFYYTSDNDRVDHINIPGAYAETNIVFIFASTYTLGNPEWKNYIENIVDNDDLKCVPIACDNFGLGHSNSPALKNINFIRGYNWIPEMETQQALIEMLHEIYRHSFNSNRMAHQGKDTSIKFFLSHSKHDVIGRYYAREIKYFIDNTNMSNFFDTTDISPGYKFDDEIMEHIKDSTLICFRSDTYYSRYWCQREILYAKMQDRPAVSVNCLNDYEDRILPAGSNMPCVHVSHHLMSENGDLSISNEDILRILTAATLETIRYHFAYKSLKYYQQQEWIDDICEIFSKPPEIRQVVNLLNDKTKKVKNICYPEPAIYSEESDWLEQLGIEAFTPLWNKKDYNCFSGIKVGISISEAIEYENIIQYMHADNLERLSQDLARHMLARSAVLLYGGNLSNHNNFTQFIFEEASMLKDRLKSSEIFVENYLAWPIYTAETEMAQWRAKYDGVMRLVECDIPDDVSDQVNKKIAITPRNKENKYIWSRCLTNMRNESVEVSDVRICAGGKLTGYFGKMPGVLEEFIIASEKKKPIYLIGAFGGVVGEICTSIQNREISPFLTEEWQKENNGGYTELQEYANEHNHATDYEHIKNIINKHSLATLARKAGLSKKEYEILMTSPFIDEIVHLIIKGLKEI